MRPASSTQPFETAYSHILAKPASHASPAPPPPRPGPGPGPPRVGRTRHLFPRLLPPRPTRPPRPADGGLAAEAGRPYAGRRRDPDDEVGKVVRDGQFGRRRVQVNDDLHRRVTLLPSCPTIPATSGPAGDRLTEEARCPTTPDVIPPRWPRRSRRGSPRSSPPAPIRRRRRRRARGQRVLERDDPVPGDVDRRRATDRPAARRPRCPDPASPLPRRRLLDAVPRHEGPGRRRAPASPSRGSAGTRRTTTGSGVPFFTMDHVDGQVPPDNLPVHDGGLGGRRHPEQQARMWWSGLDALATVHRTDWRALGLDWLGDPAGAGRASTSSSPTTGEFLDWSAKGRPQPVAEAVWEWLVANRPDEDGERRPVLGRQPRRQHHLGRLRPRRRLGLGDGHPRPTRARPRLVAVLRPAVHRGAQRPPPSRVPHPRSHRRRATPSRRSSRCGTSSTTRSSPGSASPSSCAGSPTCWSRAAQLPEDTDMGTNNLATQFTAQLLGLPSPAA